jgi:hypothetical protein
MNQCSRANDLIDVYWPVTTGIGGLFDPEETTGGKVAPRQMRRACLLAAVGSLLACGKTGAAQANDQRAADDRRLEPSEDAVEPAEAEIEDAREEPEDAAEPAEPAPAVPANMNPPGTSWWCGAVEPFCFRERQQCEGLTKGRCSERATAQCWISEENIEKQEHWYCVANEAKCRKLRAANESRMRRALSECEPWGARTLELPATDPADVPAGSGWWCVDNETEDGLCVREGVKRFRNLQWMRVETAYCFVDDERPACFQSLPKCEEWASTSLRYGGMPTACSAFR